MKVQIGDILQVDGGLVIISEVETVRAFCLPMPGFKNLKADILKHGFGVEQASRNVLERRGAAGLAAFLAEQAQGKKAAKNSMVSLELGDALCYHGSRCTVIAVTDDAALLADAEGSEWEEEREVNEFLFQDCNCKGHVAGRLDEAGRAENLKSFLAAQTERQTNQPAAGADVAAETTETQKEVMKAPKKTKEAKVKTEKQPKAEKAKQDGAAQPEIMGCRVRSVIRLLGKKGAKSDEVAKILAAHKITVPSGAIPNEIKHGKTGKGALAELSKEQVAELMALAKE